jgi:phosphoenolpyruvate phosphomutase
MLVEEAGFDAIWASSLTISAARGLPDASLLTMTDYLRAATEMAQSTSIPVLADCDSGFGNSMNVAYTVRLYEAGGIGGIAIEDKHFPKMNSLVPSAQELIAADAFARKIEAGKQAQRGPDFVLIARTEALIAGLGVDEALRRAQLYADAGADAILIHSKCGTPDEVIEFAERWTVGTPLVIVPTTYHAWRATDASASGVSMVIYANQALRAAVQAMRTVLEEIRVADCSSSVEEAIAPVTTLFELVHLDEWMAFE